MISALKAGAEYGCTAENSVGRVETTVTVEVAEAAEEAKAPVFLRTPKDVFVEAGESAELKALVYANPPARIRWEKVGSTAAWEWESVEAGTVASLTKEAAEAPDAGEYLIIAENVHGTIVGSIYLSVGGSGRPQPPRFTRCLADVWATLGSPAALAVAVTGSPKPELTWLLDGEAVRESRNLKV